MTINIIKDQIEIFLKSPEPEVMAIKGAWGVGKTYSWNKFLDEFKAKNSLSLSQYSYISLFGINSLESFKQAIFENSIRNDLIGKENFTETIVENKLATLASKSRKVQNAIKSLPLVRNFSTTIESIAYYSINKTLICIDDLERKGKDLEVKDVMGLISQLKEQKNCKIIILLNDGEEGMQDYLAYKEKVIDLELEYNPTPHECASIAFPNNDYNSVHLREFSEKLNIKNIRVLKKIERLVNKTTPILSEFEDGVKYQAIQTLVLFCWSYYCSNKSNNIPDFKFTTKSTYKSMVNKEENEESEKEDAWVRILEKYGFFVADDFDQVLAKSVLQGFIPEVELLEQARILNKKFIANISEQSFTEAWNFYHDNFDDNADEVAIKLSSSLIANAKHVSAINLNGTITLLRQLDKNQLANETIDKYIELRGDTPEIFNLKNIMSIGFSSDITDTEIREKFAKKYNDLSINEPIQSILQRLSSQRGHSEKDLKVLNSTTAEEYYSLFKNTKGFDLTNQIRACLDIGRATARPNEPSDLHQNVCIALKTIASESKINELRVKRFNIPQDLLAELPTL